MRLRSLVAASALLLMGSAVQATTLNFGGAADPSLKGTTGSLSVTDNGGGNFDVVWSMNFTGYQGSVSNHPNLTHVAFKAFKSIGTVVLDNPSLGELDWPSNVSNGGCADPPQNAKMVCVTLTPAQSATGGGTFSAAFSVTGGVLKTDEWSYRGKFGPGNGWVISESATPPIPEPTSAAVFALGALIAGGVLHRRLRG